MRNSVPTCSSDELLAHLKKGDLDRYSKLLSYLSPYDKRWFRLQLLGIRVLAYQNKGIEALKACKTLSTGLVDPGQRQCLKLEHLFYSWLLEGRKQATLDALESLTGKTSPEKEWGFVVRHIRLRVDATKLMLGMKNPAEKLCILNAYQDLISTYLKAKRVDEAFFCLMEQIELALNTPYSDISEALVCLGSYDHEPNFQNALYRKATLRLIKLRLTSEQKLRAGERLEGVESFKEIVTELERYGCKYAAHTALVSYSKLLLNYGRPLGRKLIVKCIKFFQEVGDEESIVHTVTPLVWWLKLTGRSQAVSSYLDLTLSPIPGKVNPGSDRTHDKKLRDKGLMVFQTIADVELACQCGSHEEGEQKLTLLLKRIKPFANSYLGLRVKVQLILCKLNSGKYVPLEEIFQRAKELQQLGFGRESIEFLSKQILIGLGKKQDACDEFESDGILELAGQIFSQKQDLESAQSYGFLFEVIALSHLFEMRFNKSLCALKEANLIYHKYELRPRIAFNYLYQSKVFDLQFSISGNRKDLNGGLKALQEASDLFRLLGFRRGLNRVHTDMRQLEKRFKSGTISLVPSSENIQKALSGLGKTERVIDQVELDGSLFGIFADLASKGQQINIQTVFPQSFNKN